MIRICLFHPTKLVILFSMSPTDFLNTGLYLDLETDTDSHILKIGAVFQADSFYVQGPFNLSQALQTLELLASKADYLLGHNILSHDIPILHTHAPHAAWLQKPLIDTLHLSPLAFPQNAYHHLVKDYKLVRDSLNDPVADARLAAQLFVDEWDSFMRMKTNGQGDLAAFYRFCFQAEPGLQMMFAALGIPEIDLQTAKALLQQKRYEDRLCRYALDTLLSDFAVSPLWAYALAWLSVAGSRSVLPPWVRYRFPKMMDVLRHLRDTDCGQADCLYCREQHDATKLLQRFFGFAQYRPMPQTPKGESLQQSIVESGMRHQPLLAILPTGGGKSLCYQMPALARYQRRGVLSIVVSPLQALMKDQVDGLVRRTGTPFADALYGMLTPPERGQVLERIRLGDTAILYVSPEQLRNRSFQEVIKQREIGCWIFDEAHCLSKWGHDFRTDYWYAARFIREFAADTQQAIPPVAAFTATAKKDVIAEICEHFKQVLGQELQLFEGGVERENLMFQVMPTSSAEKNALLHMLLQHQDSGCAIVYAATRKRTEEIAEFLLHQPQPINAAAFHAGLPAPQKQALQEAFIAGELPVICATNAFGMGIDKENVRLVLHADIPGSLENYLQEAGRAGRDREPAECVLLYDENDIEQQFKLSALSQLNRRDIATILRVLRRTRRQEQQLVVITSGELLQQLGDDTLSFEHDDSMADTKVKTAVAWLERAGFVQRDENSTQVFQGRPLISLEHAETQLAAMTMAASKKQAWLNLFKVLLNMEKDEGLTADTLASLAEIKVPDNANSTPAKEVIRMYQDMAGQGFISQGLQLTAFFRAKGRNNAQQVLEQVRVLETAMITTLREQQPDASTAHWLDLNLAELSRCLQAQGHTQAHPETLRTLLKGLAQDGRGLAGKNGSLDFHYVSQDFYKVRLQRDWQTLQLTAERRQAVAQVLVQCLQQKALNTAAHSTQEILLAFSYDELLEALNTQSHIPLKDSMAAVERGLLFLHDVNALRLQQGLAVFRSAMHIRLMPEAKGRRYSKGDFEPLAHHYNERVLQIHVMNQYARLALEKVQGALNLVAAYFVLERKAFIEKYFPHDKEMLTRATSAESYRKIVDSLQHPVQSSIVATDTDENILILAGPGSGKSKTVVHRCAYLLRVKRVPAKSMLLLCFNRSAAISLRRRLSELVGADARGVTVQTYHGLALRLCGQAFSTQERRDIDFAQLITQATHLLRGEQDLPVMIGDELRDRLLAGYRYILVDEYQDIDAPQYDFISALAGRTLDTDASLSLLAVGDDDQNIYGFRGTNVSFIRRFQEDYQANIHYLVDNYRSNQHIIQAANSLIARHSDRMKQDYPIRINRQRKHEAAGGQWTARDPVAQGRVQIFSVDNAEQQALALVAELQRLQSLDADWQWSECAVLAYTWNSLMPIRALCEQQGIPSNWGLDSEKLPSPYRIREIAEFLRLLDTRKEDSATPADWLAMYPSNKSHPWLQLIHDILCAWQDDIGHCSMLNRYLQAFCYDSLRDWKREAHQRQGLLLTTVHRAKGLEFNAVCIPDGDWREDTEEAGRLFYVGMTRSKQHLLLFQKRAEQHPHISKLDAEQALCFRDISIPPGHHDWTQLRYDILGLSDIFLDFAGRRTAQATLHSVLNALSVGDILHTGKTGQNLVLLGQNKVCVAQLSRSGQARWAPHWQQILEVKVLALIERYAEDSEAHYQAALRCEQWLVPVLEVCYAEQ